MATAGSIGAGLDSQDEFSVTWIVYPTSVINMAQEMGQYGRVQSRGDGAVNGELYLVISLNDFVYLNQRLYMPKDDIPKSINPLLSYQQEIKMQ